MFTLSESSSRSVRGTGNLGLGHGYFSAEKFRDPGSRRRAPPFKSCPAQENKKKTLSRFL
jgi:hypothetical protein